MLTVTTHMSGFHSRDIQVIVKQEMDSYVHINTGIYSQKKTLEAKQRVKERNMIMKGHYAIIKEAFQRPKYCEWEDVFTSWFQLSIKNSKIYSLRVPHHH